MIVNPIERPNPTQQVPNNPPPRRSMLPYVITTLLILALLAGGLYYWFQMREPFVPGSNDGNLEGETTLLSYRNDTYHFEVEYDKKFILTKEPHENNGSSMFLRNGIVLARIDIPKDLYPGTNYNEGWAAFAIGKNMQSPDCYKYIGGADAEITMTEKEVINKVEFTKAETGGVGLGNIYDSKIYRVYRNNLCYEISLNLHTTNIGNFEPGTVVAVKEDDVWNKLNAILRTYEFTEGQEVGNPNMVPNPTNPTPNTVQAGYLSGHTDLGPSKITAIIIYDSSGKIEISRKNVDASGNYSIQMVPGNYMIDYIASPDLYPHSKEPFTIKAGETHEFNFILDN